MDTAALRYRFRAGRGALVIINASHTRGPDGVLTADPGHFESLTLLREQAERRGFTVIGELGGEPSATGPLASDVRELIGRIATNDFGEIDALMVVIAAHGQQGQVYAWPERDGSSEPIELRDILKKFQLVKQDPALVPAVNTVAAKTLAGKPKLFIIDACRSQSHLAMADPLSDGPEVGAADRVFDQLRPGRTYWPIEGPDGEFTTRYSDFCVCFSTVPFNQAGVLDSGSLFLKAFAEQLRDHPESTFTQQLENANGAMQRQNAGPGRIAKQCYPQCADVKTTLTKALRFTMPDVDAPDSARAWVGDLIATCAANSLREPTRVHPSSPFLLPCDSCVGLPTGLESGLGPMMRRRSWSRRGGRCA